MMKMFVQLGAGDGPLGFEVGATYYYPGKGWLVRAYYNHTTGFDSVEGEGESLDAALWELKANWMKSWWATGAPQPPVPQPEEKPVEDLGDPTSFCGLRDCCFGYGHSGPHSWEPT